MRKLNIEKFKQPYSRVESNTLAQNLSYLGLEKLHRPAILRPTAALAATDDFTIDLLLYIGAPMGRQRI